MSIDPKNAGPTEWEPHETRTKDSERDRAGFGIPHTGLPDPWLVELSRVESVM